MTLPHLPFPPPLPERSALFLDFDGTLAAIQDDPEAVRLPEPAHDLLRRLSDRLHGAVAIVSGRDIRDLGRRAPELIWRVGGHGLEICRPLEAPAPSAPGEAPAALLDALDALAAKMPGVRIERKGPVLAVHYRAAPDAKPALAAALAALVEALESYTLQAGKQVFEMKPRGANKGVAVAALMDVTPFAGRTPVMVGDDATDEDGFIAAGRLGGYGIKVGDGPSAAAFRIPSIEEVWGWLGATDG